MSNNEGHQQPEENNNNNNRYFGSQQQQQQQQQQHPTCMNRSYGELFTAIIMIAVSMIIVVVGLIGWDDNCPLESSSSDLSIFLISKGCVDLMMAILKIGLRTSIPKNVEEMQQYPTSRDIKPEYKPSKYIADLFGLASFGLLIWGTILTYPNVNDYRQRNDDENSITACGSGAVFITSMVVVSLFWATMILICCCLPCCALMGFAAFAKLGNEYQEEVIRNVNQNHHNPANSA